MSEAKYKVMKFGAPWCAPCKALARSGALEKFKAAHPEIDLQIIDLAADQENPTEAESKAEDLADEYDVESIPTIIFEDEDGEELLRTSEATNLKGLEKMFTEASKKRAAKQTK